MIYSENSSGKTKTSCPTVRLISSGEYGHEEKNILSASCPKHQTPLSLNQNDKSHSEEKLATSEFLRTDLKNSVVVTEEEAGKWLEEGDC